MSELHEEFKKMSDWVDRPDSNALISFDYTDTENDAVHFMFNMDKDRKLWISQRDAIKTLCIPSKDKKKLSPSRRGTSYDSRLRVYIPVEELVALAEVCVKETWKEDSRMGLANIKKARKIIDNHTWDEAIIKMKEGMWKDTPAAVVPEVEEAPKKTSRITSEDLMEILFSEELV
jgi:hypothetical protein